MPSVKVPIIKGDKVNNLETDYRDALPVNMYPVKRDTLGNPGYMLSYPGIVSFGNGIGKDRGGIWNERFSAHYRVSGESLISVSETGAVTVIGDIPGSDMVSLPYSFNTQAIIANGSMYLYDPSNGLREVTDTDLGSPIDGAWIDGYYFLTDGEYVYHTDISNESSINPLSYATAEFMPDVSVGVARSQDNKIYVFGQYTIEPFVNVATDNFAFQRVQTRAQNIGIVSTHAKCELSGKYYIVGGRKDETIGVYIVGVGTSEKISTRTIDSILSKYTKTELSELSIESRIDNDVSFVIIHLPNETLCFNESAALAFGKDYGWSLLQSNISTAQPYRAINGVYDPRISKWVYGDKIDGRIGILDNDTITHYDNLVSSIFYTPFMNLETMSINSIELDIVPGFNGNNDSRVSMSLTQDGIIHGTERWMSYSDYLNYNQRFIMNRLGYVPSWLGIKFRAISTSKLAFSGLKVTYA